MLYLLWIWGTLYSLTENMCTYCELDARFTLTENMRTYCELATHSDWKYAYLLCISCTFYSLTENVHTCCEWPAHSTLQLNTSTLKVHLTAHFFSPIYSFSTHQPAFPPLSAPQQKQLGVNNFNKPSPSPFMHPPSSCTQWRGSGAGTLCSLVCSIALCLPGRGSQSGLCTRPVWVPWHPGPLRSAPAQLQVQSAV